MKSTQQLRSVWSLLSLHTPVNVIPLQQRTFVYASPPVHYTHPWELAAVSGYAKLTTLLSNFFHNCYLNCINQLLTDNQISLFWFSFAHCLCNSKLLQPTLMHACTPWTGWEAYTCGSGEMTDECSGGKDRTDCNLDTENNRHITHCALFPVPRYLTT